MLHGSKTELAFREKLTVVRIETAFAIEETPRRIIEETLLSWRKRNAMA